MADTFTQDKEDVDIKYRGRKGVTVTVQSIVARHKSAGGAKDITEFLTLVNDAWTEYQRRLLIPSNKRVGITERAPREFVESIDGGLDIITFRIIDRKYGNTKPEGERRPYKPQIREVVDHPDDEDTKLTVLGQWMDNTVELAVYSRHNKRANDIALMFEQFMHAYLWYFKEQGIQHIHFLDRSEDTVTVVNGQEFSVRPLRFHLRTEMIYQQESRKLNSIIVEYDVGRALNRVTTNEELGIEQVNVLRSS